MRVFLFLDNIKYMWDNSHTMRRARNGSTLKQWNYARALLSNNKSRYKIAIECGYSPATARKVMNRVEKATGTQIALAELYAEAGNMTLKAMHNLKSRDLDEFTNKELLATISVMVNAFDKFKKTAETEEVKNGLKSIFVQSKTIDAKATPASDTQAQVITPEQEPSAGDTNEKV